MKNSFTIPFDSIEDLSDLGAEAAWSVIKAVSDFYNSGVFPHDMEGEARLCFISIVELGREDGK